MRTKLAITVWFAACLLVILGTLPLIFNYSELIPGFHGNYCDAAVSSWSFWLVNQQMSQWWSGGSFWHTDLLYPPFGTTIAGHMLCLPKTLLFQPVFIWFGPQAAFNTAILFTMWSIIVFTYLAARVLGISHLGAFLAGFAVSFSAFIQAHAASGHYFSISIELIPLCLVFFWRWFDTLRLKYLLLFVMCASLAMWMSWFNGIYLLLAITIFLSVWVVRRFHDVIRPRFILMSILAAVCVALATIPRFIPLAANPSFMFRPSSEAYKHGADIAAYLLPPKFHSFAGHWTESFFETVPGGWMEQSLFLGYGFLILALLGARQKPYFSNPPFFWVAVAAFIFSLGPALNALGKTYQLSLPYTWLQHIWGFNGFRVPSRLSALLLICLAFWAGHGLDHLLTKKRGSIAAALVCLIILEKLHLPFLLIDPGAGIDPSRISPSGGVTALLPVDPDENRDDQFLQIYFNEPLLAAHLARIPPGVLEPLQPLTQLLGIAGPVIHDPPPPDPLLGSDITRIFGITRFVWKGKPPASTERYLQTVLPVTDPVIQTIGYTEWRVDTSRYRISESHPYRIYPIRGWFVPEPDQHGFSLKTQGPVSYLALLIDNSTAVDLDVYMEMRAALDPGKITELNWSVNDVQHDPVTLTAGQWHQMLLRLPAQELHSGLNWIRWNTHAPPCGKILGLEHRTCTISIRLPLRIREADTAL
ncbi:hypothetical protein JW979_06055 [bacterium]|nr:hypothetical protein [candidate division CSSED10-310 bacterium]